jgi:hypothetical protein
LGQKDSFFTKSFAANGPNGKKRPIRRVFLYLANSFLSQLPQFRKTTRYLVSLNVLIKAERFAPAVNPMIVPFPLKIVPQRRLDNLCASAISACPQLSGTRRAAVSFRLPSDSHAAARMKTAACRVTEAAFNIAI